MRTRNRDNGWDEYKKLIIFRLDDQSKKMDQVINTLTKMGNDVTGLKVKAAIAGGVAGLFVTTVASIAIQYLHL